MIDDLCDMCGLPLDEDECNHDGQPVFTYYFKPMFGSTDDIVSLDAVGGWHWIKLGLMEDELDMPLRTYSCLGNTTYALSMMKLYDSESLDELSGRPYPWRHGYESWRRWPAQIIAEERGLTKTF